MAVGNTNNSNGVKVNWIAPIILCFIGWGSFGITTVIGVIWIISNIIKLAKANTEAGSNAAKTTPNAAYTTTYTRATAASPRTKTTYGYSYDYSGQSTYGKTTYTRPAAQQTVTTRQAPVSQPANAAYQAAGDDDSQAAANPRSRAARLKNAFNSIIGKCKTGRTLSVMASVMSFIVGLSVSMRVFSSVYSAAGTIGGLISLAFTLAFTAGFAGIAAIFGTRISRYRRISQCLDSSGTFSIAEIAAITDIPEKVVDNDLQRMIDKGCFGGDKAYIDHSKGIFTINRTAADEFIKSRGLADNPAPTKQEAQQEVDEYERILRGLRKLNDDIVDADISYKIERIEKTSASIFSIVKEDPTKLPQIHRLMSYYLPTTMNLLQQYAKVEKRGSSGENAEKMKRDINNVLSTLTAGFEQQLDKLYASDVIDIAADVSVLENMMKRDGLAQSGMRKSAFAVQKEEDKKDET